MFIGIYTFQTRYVGFGGHSVRKPSCVQAKWVRPSRGHLMISVLPKFLVSGPLTTGRADSMIMNRRLTTWSPVCKENISSHPHQDASIQDSRALWTRITSRMLLAWRINSGVCQQAWVGKGISFVGRCIGLAQGHWLQWRCHRVVKRWRHFFWWWLHSVWFWFGIRCGLRCGLCRWCRTWKVEFRWWRWCILNNLKICYTWFSNYFCMYGCVKHGPVSNQSSVELTTYGWQSQTLPRDKGECLIHLKWKETQ